MMQNTNQAYQVRVDKDRHLLDVSFPEMTGKPYVILTFEQAESFAKAILQVVRNEKPSNKKDSRQTRELLQDMDFALHTIRALLERAFDHPS